MTSSRYVWGESELSTLYRCDTRQVDDRERSRSSHQNVAVTRKLAGEDDHLDPLLDLNQRRPSRPLVAASGESRSSQLCTSSSPEKLLRYRCDTRQVDDRERSRSLHQNVAVTRKLAGEDNHLDPLFDLNQRRPLSCYNNLTMICSSL
ncbi:hypothetical protein DY000_02047349 [Brassica cretica]|uniref:DUF4005 domain-containing protein n=1 Tax=Brassica cretica TaxID=69181 RepID=A0ABQ7F0E9_BRACR|nr:hypothetical protein DY000_02047349 [Brassica cretica]